MIGCLRREMHIYLDNLPYVFVLLLSFTNSVNLKYEQATILIKYKITERLKVDLLKTRLSSRKPTSALVFSLQILIWTPAISNSPGPQKKFRG